MKEDEGYEVDEKTLEGLDSVQRDALEAILEGNNIFLTGQAGTGKSFVISKLLEICKSAGIKACATSTTGSSAVLIGGTTIHGWSGVNICGNKTSALKKASSNKSAISNWIKTDILIIDEVSMMSPALLEILDYVGREIRSNRETPFGGLRVVLCGDFCQLPPVKAEGFCFQSPIWPEIIDKCFCLTTIFRQTAVDFCTALSEIRFGIVSKKTQKLLDSRLKHKFEGDILPTQLYSKKIDVDKINMDRLCELNEPILPYTSDDIVRDLGGGFKRSKEQLEQLFDKINKVCMAPPTLYLCVGAQVMLTVNLCVAEGLVNGSRGIITGISPSMRPIVKFLNGQILEVKPNIWNVRINEYTTIKRTQFPLILAWALTIHKSQGSTLDRAKMKLSDGMFADGMFYTALSRVSSIEGLSLDEVDYTKAKCNKQVLAFYKSLEK